jgi:mRNA interferase MazF
MAWNVVTIVPTSRSAQAAVFRPALDLLGEPTRFLIDQIRSIDTRYVGGEAVAYTERDEMAQIEHAVSRYFGLGL